MQERGRAWRRYRSRVTGRRGKSTVATVKPEKRWKHLYLRSIKLARAKQLGFDYPRTRCRQLLEKVLDE